MYLHIHCISSQVFGNGIVTLQGGFSSFDPVLYGFSFELSRGGSVLYLDTQDLQLILRSAREVRNAFPDQSAFTPEYMFIATWLRVQYPNSIEVIVE